MIARIHGPFNVAASAVPCEDAPDRSNDPGTGSKGEPLQRLAGVRARKTKAARIRLRFWLAASPSRLRRHKSP